MTSAIFTRRGAEHAKQASGKLAWRGRTVRDKQGERIGKITQIYIAEDTAAPDWALVRGDDVAQAPSFLPLQGSRSKGDEVIVPFTKAEVMNAPHTQEANRLSPEQGANLYDYYAINQAQRLPGNVGPDGPGKTVAAPQQKRSDQISRLWLHWLSDMRGSHDLARSAQAAHGKPQPVQEITKPRKRKRRPPPCQEIRDE